MEFFKSVNVDWLGKKWYFLLFSMIFSIAGVISMAMHISSIGSPVPLGIDFRGGTDVQVQFKSAPNVGQIRKSLDAIGVHNAKIVSISGGAAQRSQNELLISLPRDNNENQLDAGRASIEKSLDAIAPGQYAIQNISVVGPTVGRQLQKKALVATLWSLLGMLVYLWFRFELIYGVAAVVAVFHDTLITIGAFALTNREMSLTVIAAILTLIGYSMNDTIVVFDRIRENLRMNRKESLPDLVNRSINQTLSRTVLTSGLTFLTVLSLFVYGGEVLHGFSFALVIGILIGTYSSIAVAAPMLVAYQEWRGRDGQKGPLPAARGSKA